MSFDSFSSAVILPQLSTQSSGQFMGPFAPALRVTGARGDMAWCGRLRRPTRYISRDELCRLYEGILFANYQGAVLNAEVTFSWRLAGYEGTIQMNGALNRLLDRFRKFAAHREMKAYYYAVNEHGKHNGYHTHMSFHIPDKYRDDFRRWLSDINSDTANARRTKGFIFLRTHKQDAVHSQWRWFQYCMKGLDPRLLKGEAKGEGYEKLDTNKLAAVWRSETGSIDIKRLRIARAMGKKAQADAGYKPPFTMLNVRPEYRYQDSEYRRGLIDHNEVLRETLKALDSMDLV